ncbi:uncharacterized protein F5Z01DRAFT_675146 [Emericellopsis atlantica]|uniref:Glycosyl transferase n=1 Tax=Emericellopsis atlantica TaxID=2614577 RepID=A0A9P8CPZ6_9HYPO|nr:uncharacterized protein F5Z01DRAFT_675146 [Emericellopsis atlantica]KAG9253231.1 hypothetical protein F5Z01DRAFT_675146 [Emericellopsis atlantica]
MGRNISLHVKSVAAASLLTILLIILYVYNDSVGVQVWSYAGAGGTEAHQDQGHTTDDIPNIVHFVYILANESKGFNFEFSHFLSMYAVSLYWEPDTIFLHTNVDPDGTAVARARDGFGGKWNKLIFTYFNLDIRKVEVPSYANNGVKIQGLEHKSDFVRVKAVQEHGGIYIDWDVHALRDVKSLRQSGFNAVAGRQAHGQINSGTFMSKKGAKMIDMWTDGMHEAYNGGWTTHSNEVITRVGELLVQEPGEMLILERDAFAPGSWESKDTDNLFQSHAEPAGFTEHELAAMRSLRLAESETPGDVPEWAWNWSHTYLLHAFSPDRWHQKVHGYDHISPAYVLRRDSNFGRAVYPAVLHMYREGLIGVNDPYDG